MAICGLEYGVNRFRGGFQPDCYRLPRAHWASTDAGCSIWGTNESTSRCHNWTSDPVYRDNLVPLAQSGRGDGAILLACGHHQVAIVYSETNLLIIILIIGKILDDGALVCVRV